MLTNVILEGLGLGALLVPVCAVGTVHLYGPEEQALLLK